MRNISRVAIRTRLLASNPRRGIVYDLQRLMECAIKHFIDDAAGQRHQNQVSPCLTPLIAFIVRQLFGQTTVEFFADTRWQWLAPCKVLLNTRRQCRARTPVIAMLTHDAQRMLAVNAWPLVVCLPFWMLALRLIAAWLALRHALLLITAWLALMHVLRFLPLLTLRVPFVETITRSIAVSRISQSSH